MTLHTVAILGAGDLAAGVARRLAERALARRVVLVDADEGRARGKALDLAQSGPVEGSDVCVEGRARLADVGAYDALLVADAPALESGSLSRERAADQAQALVAAAPRVLVVADPRAGALLEAVVAAGLPRERALGSAALALAGALRLRLAGELGARPHEIAAAVMGLPPADLLVPRGAATVSGVPIDELNPLAVRRALAAVVARTPGPIALATAAARLLGVLAAGRPSLLPVIAVLAGEYGQRGVALAVPARLAAGRIQGIVELPLQGVDRVAFENAAARRSAATRRFA